MAIKEHYRFLGLTAGYGCIAFVVFGLLLYSRSGYRPDIHSALESLIILLFAVVLTTAGALLLTYSNKDVSSEKSNER